MRYSTFEQAAAEASYGMKEIDTQLQQLMAQVEQLKAKRDLLETLWRQLSSIRPTGTDGDREAVAAAETAPAEPVPPSNGAAEREAEKAGAAAFDPRSLREGWSSLGSENGNKGPSVDSILRGRH